MHEGLLVTDQEGVIRYCNSRTEELLSVENGSLLGTDATTAFAEVQTRLTDAKRVNAGWKRALHTGDAGTSLEVELTNPPRSIQADVFSVTEPSGGRRGVGVVLRDVTTERDLVRTKDELVSVVSHELRTPLASVVGFAELLRTRELSEPQRRSES